MIGLNEMEKEFSEAELYQNLSGMVFWKQLVFLLLVCQRLIPSFRALSRERGLAGEDLLLDLLRKAWDTLLAGVTKADFSAEVTQAESVAPNTEDVESDFVSSALDAAIAVSLLMKVFNDGQTNTIVEAASLARDSIDMYVQELEQMDQNDPNIETKILSHDLMQKELERQREDIAFIKALDDDISLSMTVVKEKWFDKEDSCLGLTK